MPAIEFVPIRPGDLARLSETAAEVMARRYMSGAETLPTIANDPFARSMLVDGQLVAAGGLADYGNGVGLAWAIMACPMPRRAVLPLIRMLRDGIERAPFHWIEAQTPVDLPTGLKLDRLLGFVPIGSFSTNGREFQRFRYVKDRRNGH